VKLALLLKSAALVLLARFAAAKELAGLKATLGFV